MTRGFDNLRIRFYGTQGSGSTFPTLEEISYFQTEADLGLIDKIFADLGRFAGDDGKLDCSLEEILGGSLRRERFLAYRNKLHLHRPRVYGGLTTCLHIETSDGHDIVLDCGSGFRHCALDLQARWGDRPERLLTILGTHTHFDHTEGFDQAAVCFDKRNTIRIFANAEFLRSLDAYLGIFSRHVSEERRRVQTPLTFREMPAHFEGYEIRDLAIPGGDGIECLPWGIHDLTHTIQIGRTTVTAFPVYHSAPCLAYRIEHGDKKFIFCTDHELRHGPDPDDPNQLASEEAEERVIGHAEGADILYRDGQYLRAEYDGLVAIGKSTPVPRMDWGHSCIEDIVQMARRCRVGRTFIGHHDPNRLWTERNSLDEALALMREEQEMQIELARVGTVIDL